MLQTRIRDGIQFGIVASELMIKLIQFPENTWRQKVKIMDPAHVVQVQIKSHKLIEPPTDDTPYLPTSLQFKQEASKEKKRATQ